MVKLTAKQEKYVQGLVAGLSQRKAYREAYPNSTKWKDATVDNKASAMLREDEILARYNEIINEHKANTLWTREKSVEKLMWLVEKAEKDIGEDGFRQANSTAFLNAIKELNELELLYPLKQAQLEKIKGKPEGETGAIFIESEEEMLRYIENNQHEYDSIHF